MAVKTLQNQALEYQQEIKKFVSKFRTEAILKMLLATALLVASVVAVVFFTSYFLTSGIGIMIVSSFAIYKYFTCYRDSKNIFNSAADCMVEAMKKADLIPSPETSSQKLEEVPLESNN